MRCGIMVAPNGARLKYDEHIALPLKLEEIVNTADECEKAGANAIHLHIRDNNLNHILDANIYKQTIEAIRKKCSKEFLIQTTTEAVGMYEAKDIISLVKTLKPQCTSIALKEIIPKIDDLKLLKEAKKFYDFAKNENIGIQHILYSKQDLLNFQTLLEKEIITTQKHSILFVLGRYSKDLNCDTKDIIPFLSTLKEINLEDKVHWMVCAFGQNETLSLVNSAILGGHCRVGFENSRLKANGETALNNESQVKNLREYLDSLSINKLNQDEMKKVLGIFK